jgi:hypothetical protein
LAIREHDKSRMSMEMKFKRRMAKYTWQDYKNDEDILSEIKINPVVRKIQNYRNWYNMSGQWTETGYHTRPEQAMRPKTLQAI